MSNEEIAARVEAINSKIPGWSGVAQYSFFKDVLANMASDKSGSPISVLILGVYLGRDVSYLCDVGNSLGIGHRMNITGVDKFDHNPCADWPEEKRGKTWEEAFGCPPPCLVKAFDNISSFIGSVSVNLIKSDDGLFLAATKQRYDFIYVDTSHDYTTVKRQFLQIARVCNGDAFIAGDDYSDDYGWGVRKAVGDGFKWHHVVSNWIWFSHRSALLS